jgi:hypothetical protein
VTQFSGNKPKQKTKRLISCHYPPSLAGSRETACVLEWRSSTSLEKEISLKNTAIPQKKTRMKKKGPSKWNVRRASSPVRSRHQPVQDCIEVGLFLGTDAIATDLAASDGLEIHVLDELIDG